MREDRGTMLFIRSQHTEEIAQGQRRWEHKGPKKSGVMRRSLPATSCQHRQRSAAASQRGLLPHKAEQAGGADLPRAELGVSLVVGCQCSESPEAPSSPEPTFSGTSGLQISRS